MTVKIIQTGAVREVNDSYGLRLIEHGRATAVPAPKAPKKTAKASRK